MRYSAPGFVYSVGLSLPNTAAALAAVQQLAAEPERVQSLRHLSSSFKERAEAKGFDCGLSEGYAILPIIIGDSIKATQASNELMGAGFNVLPIIAPAVSERAARLRFFISTEHNVDTFDRVLAAMQ